MKSYEGRAELSTELRRALSTQGFFYIVNHGYTQTQNDRIFDIGDVPFAAIDDEEKMSYTYDIVGTGSNQGYKPRNFWHIDAGVLDQLEHYNMNHDVSKKEHPQALRPLLPEIEAFARFNHFNVLHPILRLLALGMELPENSFVDQHGFDTDGATYVRFARYYPRDEDDETKTKNVWLKGHTDTGSITILWSQPIAALQVLSPDGKWRWIKHIENALVVNTGDAMEFLSGGFYKPTIHRVVQPPQDQRGLIRLGVFYFCMPDDYVKLVPHAESPVLQKHGIERRCDDADAPTMAAWREGRTRSRANGRSELRKRQAGVEEELINGIVVKHYS